METSMKNFTLVLLTCAALVSLVACGGSKKNTSPSPKTIAYTDPAPGTPFRFVKNASLSTSTHLVLDLVSDQATPSNGLAFDVSLINASGVVAWAKVASSDATYVRNGAVFDLGSAPNGIAATVSSAQLKAVVGQKGIASPKNLNLGVLASVALDAGSNTGSATFSIGKFQMIPGSRTITTVPTSSVSFGTVTVTG